MALLPMKMYMLKCMSAGGDFTIDSLMEAMAPLYGQEGQFKYKTFYHALSGMRSLGLIERGASYQKENGEVDSYYRITDAGVQSLKKSLPKGERS